MKKIVLALVVLVGCAARLAYAIPVQLSFTATDFTVLGNDVPPPTDPVTGVLVYEAASANSDVQSLISVALTIDGHQYALDELEFDIEPDGDVVGTKLGGMKHSLTQLIPGTNDFFLQWDPTTLLPEAFM